MADPIPAWPGELVPLDAGDVFVRSVPLPDDAVLASAGAGAAESALFVHGLGGSSRNWTDLMDLLGRPGGLAAEPSAARSAAAGEDGADPGAPGSAESRLSVSAGPTGPVLAGEALDLPGFGESPVPASHDYSIAARAATVISLLDRQGRWPVHLVGNSLGGAVCTRVAARRPDLVRTLTLISPALPDLRPRVLPLRVAALSLPYLGQWAMARLEGTTPEQRAARTISEVYADPALMHPRRVTEEVEEITRRDGLGYQSEVLIGSARAMVAEYARLGPGSLWRDAARVTAPTLVIHGSHDRLVNPAMAARAARVFRYAHVVVLPRMGHVAMLERPDRVARLMREFLAMVEPRPMVAAAGAARARPAALNEAST